MTDQHLDEITSKTKYSHLISFVYGLLGAGVSKDLINTNDWENNLKPSVYVGIGYSGKIRRYSRCSNYDLLNAIRFVNKLTNK